jgi:SnoaL-like domain
MVHPAVHGETDRPQVATIRRFFEAIQGGEYAELLEVLTPNAVTRWPQSGELITGPMACVRVYENYPGGPPAYSVRNISGCGDQWVAELVADYGAERWFAVSVIEFDGSRIARMTDYFGPSLAPPDWRHDLVELEHLDG